MEEDIQTKGHFYYKIRKDLIEQFKNQLNWLETHNKNYNKKQYYTIVELQDTMKFILENFIVYKDKEGGE